MRVGADVCPPHVVRSAWSLHLKLHSADGVPPPGAFVTARRMEIDPRAEALYGERVPYIISKGMDGPKAKQAHRALTPEEFLEDR